MRKLYVHQRSDGCIESFLDFARSRSALEAAGWELVDDPGKADMVLVNTCIVGELVQQHCVEDIKALKARMRPGAELVVTGCMPDYDRAGLDALGVTYAFSPRKMEGFLKRYQLSRPEQVDALEPEYLGPYNLFNWVSRGLKLGSRFHIPLPEYLFRRFSLIEDRDMTFLRVCRGCLESCTYCATKFATGKLESEPISVLLERFDQALASGKRNFALCGEDTGAYGHDLGTHLPALLSEMLRRPERFILNIRQHQPHWILRHREAYFQTLADPRVKSIALPFQCGSDRVLKAMGRRYTALQLERMLEELHRAAPHLMLRTHVIAGFPGESEIEFEQTCRLVDRLPWDMVLVFPYTDRPRTRAFDMQPKVPPEVIRRRTWKLIALVMKNVYLNRGNPFPFTTQDPMSL